MFVKICTTSMERIMKSHFPSKNENIKAETILTGDMWHTKQHKVTQILPSKPGLGGGFPLIFCSILGENMNILKEICEIRPILKEIKSMDLLGNQVDFEGNYFGEGLSSGPAELRTHLMCIQSTGSSLITNAGAASKEEEP